MSVKAKKLLKEVIRIYRDEDGATEMGSYRDAFTDLMHMVMKDKAVKLDRSGDVYANIKIDLVNDAYSVFVDESESAENALITKLKTRDLPLHLNDKHQFDSSRKLLTDRLKSNS